MNKDKIIVKYNNYMNELSLGAFKSAELDMLMAICSQMIDKGTYEVEFTFADIRNIANLSHSRTQVEFDKNLKEMNKKLNSVVGHYEDEEEEVYFTLFPTLITRKKEGLLKISVNEKFAFVLNELTSNFTKFELREFINLKSKYSKNLFRLLKQFDNDQSAWRVFEADDLRVKLGCPVSYPNKRFVAEILNPSVEELKGIFTDLELTIHKARKKGNPISRYEFRWKYAVDDELPGQMRMSDFIDTDLSQEEKQKAVKVATDIVKGNKKTKSKNSFNPKNERHYSDEELESLMK